MQLASFAERFSEKFFLTITAGNPSRTVDRKTGRLGGNSTDVIFEFEFRFGGEVIKTFVAKGPQGGTATIVVPVYRLVGGVGPRLAEAIVAFLDNPKRFKNSKQVGSYVGLRTR